VLAKISGKETEASAIRSGELDFLQHDSLHMSGLVHGFFNRHGGASSGVFTSLNLSFGVGDDEKLVRANRLKLKQAFNVTSLVSARQVHGNKVQVLASDLDADLEVDGYDALVTNRQVCLMIQQADCQAVIFHDPIRKVIGAAHAGWRGSVGGIIGETVRAMTNNFSSDPADIRAVISPSLGPCCAEFVNYREELPAWMHDYQVRPDHFDFWAISMAQLHGAGLKPVNIHKAGVCTRCNSDYFSYRRSRVTGRGATIIGLVA
jgi:YfiH family protein